ncbi:MAG TPA: rod shape-determining protein MreC [Nocardioidaceae bacterium]|nr:rod shape-determining protein MreC [Nocardioidaceae bacterium]
MARKDRQRLRNHPDPDRRRPRAVLALLLLASVTVITLDARPSGDSPIEPLRAATGAAFGPLESGVSAVVGPLRAVPEYFGDVDELRAANARLEREKVALQAQLRTTEHARERAAELDRMLGVADRQDLSLVPARVVTLGAAQAFSRTATIDAGSRDGVLADMTVVNGHGLVGRVLSSTPTTATVLLAIDAKSVVGGRLASSSELGFLSGDGDISADGRLMLELVDTEIDPSRGDTVVTWGSRNDVPYIADVPIGTITEVSSSPRQLSKTATVRPFVDFSALDLVGVVVDAGEHRSRESVEAVR